MMYVYMMRKCPPFLRSVGGTVARSHFFFASPEVLPKVLLNLNWWARNQILCAWSARIPPPLGSQVRACRLFLSRSATPVDASALSSETCFLRAPVCPASVREVVETSEAR